MLATVQQAVGSGVPAELEAAAKAAPRRSWRAIPGRGPASRPGTSSARSSSGGGQWDAAAAAFGQAAARRDGGSVAVLSRLGQGYAYEAKGEPARALEAFQQALAGRGPKDFLYGDLLLAKARAQEQAKDSGGAIATYKQYLKDLPSSERVAGRADPPRAARQRGLTPTPGTRPAQRRGPGRPASARSRSGTGSIPIWPEPSERNVPHG